MQGVEEIEKIFGHGALDEAAAAVVHIDGNEGKSGNPGAQHAAADDGLQETSLQ